jgi:hypothetical protein
MKIKKVIKEFLFAINKNPISTGLYQKEIKNRSKLKLTDIAPLSKHIQMFSPYTSEINHSNDWYGHAHTFKKYLGLPSDYRFKSIIEHGFYLTNHISEAELENQLPTFITYSNFRRDVLKKYGKDAFNIGPFINYASHYLSPRQIGLEKKRLGQSLLYFPMHSSFEIDVKYGRHEICKRIRKIGRDFNSVRICLYWADVIKGYHQIYQDYGFECVTAGHILDPLFLPRLKSIIETSSATISNVVSTQVGYCIFMGKPHYVMPLKTDIDCEKKLKTYKSFISNYFETDLYQRFLHEFSEMKNGITPKQRQLVNQYWGVDQIKSKNEFLKIVHLSEKYFKEQH